MTLESIERPSSLQHQQSFEALYVVEFGDIEGIYRNGGVVVLETGRIFGGDSGYYYIGNYSIKEGKLTGTAKIVKHNPLFGNAFGDGANSFDVDVIAAIIDGEIEGSMMRVDMPSVRLPIRFMRIASLP